MKKKHSKILGLALVASFMMTLLSFTALATDVPADKTGFIPSEDSTWGDLYRHFDPEGFDALSPEEKQIYDSTLLISSNNIAAPSAVSTGDDAVSAFMESHGMENYVSTSSIIYPTEETDAVAPTPLISDEVSAFMESHGMENYVSTSSVIRPTGESSGTDSSSRIGGIELANLTMSAAASNDSIDYVGVVTSTIPCPKLGIAVTLYDENGIFVDFNSESDENTMLCTMNDSFDGLERNTSYQVHGLALITPPPGYVATPAYILLDCKTT